MSIPIHLAATCQPARASLADDHSMIFSVSAALAAGVARWLNYPTLAFQLCGNPAIGGAMLAAATYTWGQQVQAGAKPLELLRHRLQNLPPNLFLYSAQPENSIDLPARPRQESCIIFSTACSDHPANSPQQLGRITPDIDWITIRLPDSEPLSILDNPHRSNAYRLKNPAQVSLSLGHHFLSRLTSYSIAQVRERADLAAADFLSNTDYQSADEFREGLIASFALIAAIGEIATSLQITDWPEGAAIEACQTLLEHASYLTNTPPTPDPEEQQ